MASGVTGESVVIDHLFRLFSQIRRKPAAMGWESWFSFADGSKSLVCSQSADLTVYVQGEDFLHD